MPKANRCPRCRKRLSSDAVRCIGCGASPPPVAVDRRHEGAFRPVGMAAGVVVGVIMLAASLSDQWVPAVADWYAGMALRLQAEPTQLASRPASADEPFYICARAVVRRVGSESSVATFGTRETAISRELEDGRLVLRSYLDESGESGEAQRHVFTCTLRQLAGLWIIDDLEVEEVERLPSDLALRVR